MTASKSTLVDLKEIVEITSAKPMICPGEGSLGSLQEKRFEVIE